MSRMAGALAALVALGLSGWWPLGSAVAGERGAASQPRSQTKASCYGPSQGRLPDPHEGHCRNFRTPRVLKSVKPEYPDMTESGAVDGTILLDVLVCRDGRVLEAVVDSSSFPLLDESVRRAALQWRFASPRCGRQRVAAWIRVPMEFHLR